MPSSHEMVARTESYRQSTDTHVVAAALAAVALFVVTWALLHVGFYRHKQVLDTPIYQRYGNAIARGEVPYRDFAVEYPPGALAVFALPGPAEPGSDQNVTRGFRRTFETLMWICGAAALIAMAFVLRAQRAPPGRVWGALAFTALAPLAVGSVILSRFDLWPAALVAAAVAALATGRWRLGSVVLGLAVSVKLYPAVLVPLAVASAWRREGRRAGLLALALVVGAAAVVFLPFFVLAPHGVWESISGQLRRPLQLESLGSAVLLVSHHVFGTGVTVESSHGSQNLAGAGPDALAAVLTALQAASLLWIWTAYARGRIGLVQAAAAALTAFVAFGKVLSPQFVIWLIAMIPLVPGRRGLKAMALLAAALVLTQIWFPFRYWDLANHLDATVSWLVLARDVVLVALAVLLAFPDERRDARELVADVPG
jgi:Glycosyltransferase family 87